jgi:serine/threonine-protein kinase
MYELLCGRVPFPGEGFGEILVAHLTRQPDSLSSINPDVRPELEAIVMHAMEKDRNRRFQSMDEFSAALADPAAHLASYNPLPGYTPPAHSGHTMSLPAGGGREPTGAQRITGMGNGPNPTTLSGAAGEVPASAPKSRMPLIAVLGGLVAIGAGGGVMMLKGKEAAPPVAAVTQPPPKDEMVKFTITSDPPGARVFRADTGQYESGVTPLTFSVKKGTPAFDVQVKLEGHKPGLRSLTTDQDHNLLVPLDKEAAAAPVAAPPTAAAPEEKTEEKPKKERHHSSSSGRTKSSKPGKEEGGSDDMKLLQPQF